MGSAYPATAIIPIELGPASTFDQDVFPLAYYETDGNFNKGSFLIKATLAEMKEFKKLGIDLNQNEDFIFYTRVKVEALKVQKAKLQDNRKTLNPFKAFLNYRAARLFHEASMAVYLATKRTSEKIKRDMDEERKKEEKRTRVVPSTQMRVVNGAAPPNAVIKGISIDLPEGWNDDVERTIDEATETIAITDPFQNNSLISQLRDDEHAISLIDDTSLLDQHVSDPNVDGGNRTSIGSGDLQQFRPTSPQSPTINVFITSSSVAGLTFNSGSRNSSGAPVTQFTP